MSRRHADRQQVLDLISARCPVSEKAAQGTGKNLSAGRAPSLQLPLDEGRQIGRMNVRPVSAIQTGQLIQKAPKNMKALIPSIGCEPFGLPHVVIETVKLVIGSISNSALDQSTGFTK